MASESDLTPGETALLLVRRHPVVLIQRVWKATVLVLLLLVVGAIVQPSGSLRDLKWFVLLALFLALLVFIDLQYIVWRSETFTITDQRVILRRGVIGRFSRSIGLSRVQDITTSQGLLGRMLDYGTVEVESAGKDGAEVLMYVPQPSRFRNVLVEHLQSPRTPADLATQGW